MFIVIATGIIGILYGYCGWRLIPSARLTSAAGLLVWLGLATLALLPSLYIVFLRSSQAPGWLKDGIAWVAYLGLGFAVITASLLLLRDLGWLLWVAADRLITAPGPADENSSAPMAADRRELLLNTLNLGVLGLAGAGTLLGVYRARRRPRVVEVTVPIQHLPAAFEGFSIAHITDLHAGPTIKRDFVATVVEAANGIGADIAVFTGDLVDGSVAALRFHVAPLSGLLGPEGRYFVTGNHEYYSDIGQWTPAIRDLGFDLLVNEHRVIRRGDAELVIGGVTDCSAGHMVPGHTSDPSAALQSAPSDACRILLAHQPLCVAAGVDAGADLVLSGHTHGGQFAPWKFLVPLQQPYLAGLHRVGASAWVYVSRGVGYWGPPIRLGVPPEVAHIRLTRA